MRIRRYYVENFVELCICSSCGIEGKKKRARKKKSLNRQLVHGVGLGYRRKHSWSSIFTHRRNHSLCLLIFSKIEYQFTVSVSNAFTKLTSSESQLCTKIQQKPENHLCLTPTLAAYLRTACVLLPVAGPAYEPSS